MILLFFLLFVSLSLCLEKLIKPRLHIGALLAVCFIILAHFVAGIAGWPLYMASYVVMGVSAICGCSLLVPSSLQECNEKKRYFHIGTILVAGLLIYLRVQNGYFSSWDDFTHWGVIAKELFYSHHFTQDFSQTSILFTDYPPAIALFYYYVMQFTGFSEGNVFFAHAFIMLSLALAVVDRHIVAVRWGILGVLLVWLSFDFNADSYHSLFVDGILGAFFGAAIVVYLSERERGFFAIALLLPILLTLPLIKASGSLFLFFAVAIIAVDILWKRTTGEYPVKRTFALLLFLSLVVSLSLITKQAWTDAIEHLPNPMQRQPFTLERLLNNAQAPEFQEKYDKTIRNFIVKAPAVFRSGGGLLLLLLCVLSFRASRRFAPEDSAFIKRLHLCLLIGAFMYCVGLLALYLTSFSTVESINLASHKRYIRTYFMGWSLVSIFLLIQPSYAQGYSLNNTWRKGLIALGVISIALVTKAFIKEPKLEPETQRQNIRAEVAQLIPLYAKGDSVYVIWEGYNGLDCYMVNYELTPIHHKAREECKRYSQPHPHPHKIPAAFAGVFADVTFKDASTKQESTAGYDWLFIPRGSPHIADLLADHFENPSDVLQHQFFQLHGTRFVPVGTK